MGINKFNMKKNSKKSKIDKYGLCSNEYKNNRNNAKLYFDRSIGKSPEMEVSKAMAKILKSQKSEKRPLATKIIGDEQVSGCILQPHYFVIIDR